MDLTNQIVSPASVTIRSEISASDANEPCADVDVDVASLVVNLVVGKRERAAGHDDRDTGCTDDTMHAQPYTPPKNHGQDNALDQNHTALRYDTVTTAKRRTPKPSTRRIAPQLPESAVCFVQPNHVTRWDRKPRTPSHPPRSMLHKWRLDQAPQSIAKD